ncbi:protein phosphatase 2C domain-containing protein [Occallatibacter savannae]|uniref:protein phosphatase 2C domain-containing protein n=1 Tax=Occallatibacter savannae TaxID=1002691 RepID=UPI000D692725|nr:protein phosphatase 2C domain-containing protein [Occallatibacter savannae]
MPPRLIAAGRSDTGRTRSNNEDRVLVDLPKGLFLVVDGMGGQAAGERAAEVAARIIAMRLARQTGDAEKRVREAFALASTEIYDLAAQQPELKGMACVATLALIEGDRVVVGHVGDSRLYLLEPASIRKVTSDHSPVGELEDAGKLSEEDAMRHPRRSQVYRDLGSAPHAPDDPDFVEVHSFVLPDCSALLLCSDGLTDQVPAQQIRRIVEHHAADPNAAALALIEAANDAGGKDNVSAILVETAQYAGISEKRKVRTSANFGWLWFLAGLLVATALFGILRPYIEQTSSGNKLNLGTVRRPHTWSVGPGGISSIEEALEKASTGDTISVAPGEYHEALHLRSGVSLVSLEVYGAKIIAPGVAVIGDSVHDARFSGFEILGPGEIGIQLVNSDVELTNLKVTGMSKAGVEIDGGKSSLQGSTIEANGGTGVYVHGLTSANIDHNVIRNNGHGSEPLPGLFVGGSATPHLWANVIAGNGKEQVWISPFFNQGTLLKDNEIAPASKRGELSVKVVTR